MLTVDGAVLRPLRGIPPLTSSSLVSSLGLREHTHTKGIEGDGCRRPGASASCGARKLEGSCCILAAGMTSNQVKRLKALTRHNFTEPTFWREKKGRKNVAKVLSSYIEWAREKDCNEPRVERAPDVRNCFRLQTSWWTAWIGTSIFTTCARWSGSTQSQPSTMWNWPLRVQQNWRKKTRFAPSTTLCHSHLDREFALARAVGGS